MRDDSNPLKEIQHKILNAIRSHVQENDCPPTVREIQEAVGLSSPSHVHYHLSILESKGYIRRTPDVSRGIEVVADADARRRAILVSVPIIGAIAAGEPIHAAQISEGDVYLTRDVARVGDYALRVKGNSMIDDHIENGDLVIVRKQDTADDGDTVVALLLNGADQASGEATLKRFYRHGQRADAGSAQVRLEPRNAGMQPIIVEATQVRIQGKVVGVLRMLA
jgi:repressor LexA